MLQESGEKKNVPVLAREAPLFRSPTLPQVVLQMMINKWALACGDCSDECLTSISKIVFRYSTMCCGLRQHGVHASHPSGRQKWRRWRRHTGTQHLPAGHASPSTRQPVFFSNQFILFCFNQFDEIYTRAWKMMGHSLFFTALCICDAKTH